MPWQVEQVTGATSTTTRCVWFNGYIHAFTGASGVWRRDGVGPWTEVFDGVGRAWVWDGQIWSGQGGWPTRPWHIWRSTDGINWTFDFDLTTLGSGQGSWENGFVIGGYGDYLYVANHDGGGGGATYFYRRDLAGNWIHHSTHAGVEGAGGRGIVGFGGEIYWTNSAHARRWDGAAWAIEPTLDAQGGTWLSVLDDILYVRTSTSYSLLGGYYWRTTTSTEWAFLNLPVPDNTWGGWTLCQGADGENYALAQNGTTLRIYRQAGEVLNLIAYQATVAPGLGTRGGICVDAAGAMYFGTLVGGNIRFFAFVPDHNVTGEGGGLRPQALDVDGDGDSLFVAVYNAAGQPVLIRVMLPLTATSPGSAMFDPTDGDSINVKCSNVGGRLAIAGNFAAAGNEQVETSIDSGVNWVDVDRDGWGVETAQPLLVGDNIEQIMVALQTAQDITETINAGATPWLINNPAVAYSPIAAAKLPQGDEMILSGSGLGVDYSPNRGAELHDTGGPTDAVALEVV